MCREERLSTIHMTVSVCVCDLCRHSYTQSSA